MKAVNLIPAESGRAGGRSGAGPFVLLGVLAVLVSGVSAYVLTNNTVVERRAEVASLQTQVRAAQTQAEAMRPYREFAALADARVQTVRQLGQARFDWNRALRDFAKVVPEDVWLTSLLGTVATGVAVEGAASGATSSLRSAVGAPAIELTGCTESHESVVRLISRLRLMTGVQRVSLSDSSKQDGSGGGDCRNGNANFPQFQLVVFFAPIPTASAAAATPAAGATQPAASTAPAPIDGSSAGSDVR